MFAGMDNIAEGGRGFEADCSTGIVDPLVTAKAACAWK